MRLNKKIKLKIKNEKFRNKNNIMQLPKEILLQGSIYFKDDCNLSEFLKLLSDNSIDTCTVKEFSVQTLSHYLNSLVIHLRKILFPWDCNTNNLILKIENVISFIEEDAYICKCFYEFKKGPNKGFMCGKKLKNKPFGTFCAKHQTKKIE
jgi:hypothetical protein